MNIFTIVFLSLALLSLFIKFPEKREVAYYRVVDGQVQKSTSVLVSTGEMVWEDVPTLTNPGSAGGWSGEATMPIK